MSQTDLFVKLYDVFASSQNVFLTVKGEKAHQKMDTIIKMCKKRCKTFAIVRECNKKAPGFHYHAILKNPVKVSKSWYKKGVHINEQAMKKAHVSNTFTQKEIYEFAPHMDPEDLKAVIESDICRNKIKQYERMSSSLMKVLLYMGKDVELPAQYTDYYCQVAGKSIVL